jgi:hypothetical protein
MPDEESAVGGVTGGGGGGGTGATEAKKLLKQVQNRGSKAVSDYTSKSYGSDEKRKPIKQNIYKPE